MARVWHKISALLCFLGSEALFAQSLGPDYNLGRVTGGPMGSHSVYSDKIGDDLLLGDGFSFRFGKESFHQVDWNGALLYSGEGSHPTVGMVPYSIHGVVRPDFGHQLEAHFFTPVFSYWYLNGEHQSGLTDSLKSSLSYSIQYDMLTREGHIDIRPEEYEWTFRRGPMVDGGEFRNHIAFRTDVGDMAEDRTDNYFFHWTPALGLLNGLQLTADYRVGWLDRDASWKQLDWRLEGRFHQFYLENALLASASEYSGLFAQEHNTWEIRGGAVLGNRNLSFQNVNGNWDHYFNPMLGFGQLLLEAFNTQSLDWDTHEKSAGGTVLIGAAPFLTLGASGQWWNHLDSTGNAYRSRLHVNLANTSLRNEGPADVHAMEYRFGFIPRTGEFQLFTDFALPLHKGTHVYQGSQAADPIQGLIRTILQGGSEPTQEGNGLDDGSKAWASAKLRLGISEHVFVVGQFAHFPDGFETPERTLESASWGSLHIGVHAFPYFLAEIGLLAAASSEDFEPGPAFLRVMHSF